MSKEYVDDASALRIKELRKGLRHEIEKYFVEQKCSTKEVMSIIPMALHDIFGSIAKIEDVSHDEVFGTFVKAFGAWNYIKATQEG